MTEAADRATTASLQAAYPFIAGGDLGAAGVYPARVTAATVRGVLFVKPAQLAGAPKTILTSVTW